MVLICLKGPVGDFPLDARASRVWYGSRLKRAGCMRDAVLASRLERPLGREWDWIADLGDHLRSGSVSKYCGVSVDTRMAPGDGDASPYHAERRDHAGRGERGEEGI